MRFRSSAAAVLALLLFSPATLAQSKMAVAPAAKHFTLGAMDVWALHDNANAVPNDNSVFAVGLKPSDVAAVLRSAGAPADKIPLEVNDLLIREPHRLVLIDTGYHGVILKSLALAGFAPADVTDVLLTHTHPDHIGGLVAGGHSVFSRAAIRMSAKEWAYMQRRPDARAVVAAIAPQVRTFEPGTAVLPGITPVALYGHTPGHVGYRIVSDGHTLFDIGDMAHSSVVSLAKPAWRNGFDGDQRAAATLRQQEFSRLAATHGLIFAGHFPFPDIGTVEKSGNGFRFQPVTGDKL